MFDAERCQSRVPCQRCALRFTQVLPAKCSAAPLGTGAAKTGAGMLKRMWLKIMDTQAARHWTPPRIGRVLKLRTGAAAGSRIREPRRHASWTGSLGCLRARTGSELEIEVIMLCFKRAALL